MNYYVYFFRDGKYFFDRTFPPGLFAQRRVDFLKTKYADAVYVIDHVIKGAYY